MPIVLPDLSGLSQGISTAGGALADALQARAEKRLKLQQTQLEQQKQSQGLELISDWARGYDSSKSPTENIGTLSQALQAAGTKVDPAVIAPIIKGVLEKAVSQQGDIFGAEQLFGGGSGAQQPLPGQAPQAGMQQQAIPGQQAHGFGQQVQAVDQAMPGQRQQQPPMPQQAAQQPQQAPQNRLESATDSQLVQWQASPNKMVSKAAEAEFNRRDISQKRWSEDRKYAFQRAKPFLEKIGEDRAALPNKKLALNDIKFGVENRDPATQTKDWWLQALGKAGERFVSPEGVLLESGVKSYLISDLGTISGRPNQYLEQRFVASLPGIGKSQFANEMLMESFDSRLKIEDEKLRITDELTSFYEDPKQLGFVPPNIDKMVDEQLRPIVQQIQTREAYKFREIQEKEHDDKWMREQTTKKVVKGTPLTLQQMTYFVDKYGKDKARETAEKLGYTIPTIEEYRRYQQ